MPTPADLPELAAIEALARAHPDAAEVLVRVEGLPVHAFRFGTADPAAPALLVVGGVHGLERIGTGVAIAYLTALTARRAWDRILGDALARCRIVVVPLLNPAGMRRGRRANGNGVDLMRNAPDAARRGTPLLGGQRLSPRLPWYMGAPGAAMEPEAAALTRLVETSILPARFAVALDVHSGYGFVDRIWYPYARTRAPLPDLPTIEALAGLLDTSLPNHVYQLEQTSRAYTIRGDLWDHLYDRGRAAGAGVLVPLTLEMGSWTWVRKNPRQGLSALGRFNPMKPHRVRRTLRRHLPLLDFLFHAVASHDAWRPR